MSDRDRSGERRTAQLVRAVVLAWYGQACACCSGTDRLGVDHVNGDGPRQRDAAWGSEGRKGYNPGRLYRWLIEHGFPDGYQTLCLRCNSSKGNRAACMLHGDGPRAKSNAANQAAWRARHAKGRTVPTDPATAGGRILAYLAEHGPTRAGVIAADLGLSYASATVNLSGLLSAGHVRRPSHGVYERG